MDEIKKRDFSDQAEAERQMIERGFNRAQKRQSRVSTSELGASRDIIEQGAARLLVAIEKQFRRQRDKRGPKNQWFHLLDYLRYDDLANVAMRTSMDAASEKMSFNHYVMRLGKALEGQVYAQKVRDFLLEENPDYGEQNFAAYNEAVKSSSQDMDRKVDYAKWYADNRQWTIGINEWTNAQHVHAATLLYMTVAQEIPDIVCFPKVELEKKNGNKDMARIVDFTPEITELLEQRIELRGWLTPDFSPMTSPPNDWADGTRGPYNLDELAFRCALVRNMRPPQKVAIDAAIADGSMYEALDALNFLQKVPLTINKYVLEAVLWASEDHERHENIEGFPALRDHGVTQEYPKDASQYAREELAAISRNIKHMKKRKNTVKSNLVTFEDDIREALGLLEVEQYYLPYNFDTRSRIYHLSKFGHHRHDPIRAMVQFANGSPVTKDNVQHLKYKAANTWGNAVSSTDDRKTDKLPMHERWAWADDNMELLLLCGEDFTDPKAFAHWSVAASPLQHLATCRELYNYHRFGEGYICRLPIDYDGTNSGLQHYGGLLRSERDGEKVNLVPKDAPEDIYQYVADRSTELAQADADGDDEDKAEYARLWLEFGITRSVVKRNTMVFPYNSNARGMGDQVYEDTMRKLNDDHLVKGTPHPFIDEKVAFQCARYLGQLNYRAIQQVIEAADIGLTFLKRLCKIMYDNGKHMTWITEIGFPVYLHYVEDERDRIETPFYNQETNKVIPSKQFKVNLTKPTTTIDKRQSRNGIAPCFIHSLDATHLMMTANKCRQYDVQNLLVVHDSFATDIGGVEIMNECIRASFIELYRDRDHFEDLLERCTLELMSIGVDVETIDWPEVPKQGTLDLMRIMDSLYAFS